MDANLIAHLDGMVARRATLTEQLTQSEVLNNPKTVRELSQELSSLEKVLKYYSDYQQQQKNILEAEQLTHSDNSEMRQFAAQELQESTRLCAELETELKRKLLLSTDADAEKNAYVEIRVGAGGEESSLFVADLLRMYIRYTERKHWKGEVVHSQSTSVGGYRIAVLRVEGASVYGALRFESGVHRVQRIPETESQGRIHTSACTVAVLQEAQEMEVPNLSKSDLRVDTYRASGAGGQHVNKTDSAVRITHLPTGISVECQQERSQLQNRIRAMALLQTHLLAQLKQGQEDEISAERRSLIGSGDRSEKIRTYNFPQARVTDHRINLTVHKLQAILDGELGDFIQALQQKHEDQLLNAPPS